MEKQPQPNVHIGITQKDVNTYDQAIQQNLRAEMNSKTLPNENIAKNAVETVLATNINKQEKKEIAKAFEKHEQVAFENFSNIIEALETQLKEYHGDKFKEMFAQIQKLKIERDEMLSSLMVSNMEAEDAAYDKASEAVRTAMYNNLEDRIAALQDTYDEMANIGDKIINQIDTLKNIDDDIKSNYSVFSN